MFIRGKWRVVDGRNIQDENDFCIAQINTRNLQYSPSEHAENSRLIAAAPELLEALKDVFALMDEGFLVRNIQGDHEADWAVKALPNIARLKKAFLLVDALDKAEGK